MNSHSAWQVATLKGSLLVASDVKALTFQVDSWIPHKSGQHYSIKLTSKEGYVAERDYSIASPPEQAGEVEFGIQLLPQGEVSPFLFALKIGGQIEIHGPIGGHFVWDTFMPRPLVFIGGGSGMVPLMSMLRHKALQKDTRQTIFLISAQDLGKVLYKDELAKLSSADPSLKIVYSLTRFQPPNWAGYNKRFDVEILTKELAYLAGKMPLIYICGPTPFVENIADTLLQVGFNAHEIKTERFG